VWQGALRAASSGAVVRPPFGILSSKNPDAHFQFSWKSGFRFLPLAAGQGFMRNPRGEKEMSEIRIYVACLAAYNSGVLHGRWIDANQDPYDIWNEVSAMLRQSPIMDAEEWAIHDYEGFEGAPISEYESFDSVSEIAAFVAEYGALGAKLLSYYSSLEEAKTALEDRYAGEYQSLSDFAQEITEQSTTIPENLAFYIDYEKMGRDLAINDVFSIETNFDQVHIFWGC
jgi:antirestriction protein